MLLVKTDLHKKYLFPSGAENTYVIVVSEGILYFMQLEQAALLRPSRIFSLGINAGVSAEIWWVKLVPGQSSSVARPRQRWSLPGVRAVVDAALETGPEGS